MSVGAGSNPVRDIEFYANLIKKKKKHPFILPLGKSHSRVILSYLLRGRQRKNKSKREKKAKNPLDPGILTQHPTQFPTHTLKHGSHPGVGVNPDAPSLWLQTPHPPFPGVGSEAPNHQPVSWQGNRFRPGQ